MTVTDEIQRPDWSDGAPEHGPAPWESGAAWAPDGGTVADAATGHDLIKQPTRAWDGATGLVDDVKSVGELTSWGEVWSLANSMAGNASQVISAADKFQKGVQELFQNPVDWLAGTLVDFLMDCFQPLQDIVGMVTGNEGAMKTSAKMWDTVSAGAPQVADYVTETGLQGIEGWDGEAAQGARTRISEAGEAIRALGFVAVGLEHLMIAAAKVAKKCYDKALDYIKQGVSWVLQRILPYIASSFATFGAMVPVAIADTVRKVVSLVMSAVNMIKEAMEIFKQCAAVVKTIEMIMKYVKPVIVGLKKANKYYKSAKPYLDYGTDLVQQAGR
jgi:hypothetical protein